MASEDIKIMFDGDDKFVIAHVTYEDKFGGKILQKMDLSGQMFKQLIFRVNQAKENYEKGIPHTENE